MASKQDVTRVAQRLDQVRPMLRANKTNDPRETEDPIQRGFVRWWWGGPGEIQEGNPESISFGLLAGGRQAYESLIDTVTKLPIVERSWGTESVNTQVRRALARLTDVTVNSKIVATQLIEDLEQPQPERFTFVPIYGLKLAVPVNVCGIHLREVNADALKAEFGLSLLVQDLLDKSGAKTTAVMKLAVDHERSVLVLRERAQLAITVLMLLTPDDDIAWSIEPSVSLGSIFEAGAASQTVGTPFADMTPNPEQGVPLKADQTQVEEGMKKRRGVRRLTEIAIALPVRPADKVGLRLFRAATRLARSLSGSLEDRFLLRWFGLEALFGENRAELSERLSERIAVVNEDVPEHRSRYKIIARDSYDRRSGAAHGEDEQIGERDAREALHMLARALERVAALVEIVDEKALFAQIASVPSSSAHRSARCVLGLM